VWRGAAATLVGGGDGARSRLGFGDLSPLTVSEAGGGGG
jgi:hypothetical protein